MSSDQFSKALAARPLLDQPGTKYRYGKSISILGRYLEVLEGKSLDVVMQERLFGPLKMKDTGFWLKHKDDVSRVANLWVIAGGKLVPVKRFRSASRLEKPAPHGRQREHACPPSPTTTALLR